MRRRRRRGKAASARLRTLLCQRDWSFHGQTNDRLGSVRPAAVSAHPAVNQQLNKLAAPRRAAPSMPIRKTDGPPADLFFLLFLQFAYIPLKKSDRYATH